MACNCLKKSPASKKSLDQIYLQKFNEPTYKEPCNMKETDIMAFKERLKCLKKKVPLHQHNRYLGIINSMLNLKNYCKYNTKQLKELLDECQC